MRFLKIIKGKIEVSDVSQITFEMIQREVGGRVKPIDIHRSLNNRAVVMFSNEDQKSYKNFIYNGVWILGHAVITSEKRDGTFLNMSDHEINSMKMLSGELISLMPTHMGYSANTRREAE